MRVERGRPPTCDVALVEEQLGQHAAAALGGGGAAARVGGGWEGGGQQRQSQPGNHAVPDPALVRVLRKGQQQGGGGGDGGGPALGSAVACASAAAAPAQPCERGLHRRHGQLQARLKGRLELEAQHAQQGGHVGEELWRGGAAGWQRAQRGGGRGEQRDGERVAGRHRVAVEQLPKQAPQLRAQAVVLCRWRGLLAAGAFGGRAHGPVEQGLQVVRFDQTREGRGLLFGGEQQREKLLGGSELAARNGAKRSVKFRQWTWRAEFAGSEDETLTRRMPQHCCVLF